jgi:hypothetical protein
MAHRTHRGGSKPTAAAAVDQTPGRRERLCYPMRSTGGSQWCYRSGYGVNLFEAQAGSGAHRVAPMADDGGSALARGEEVAA